MKYGADELELLIEDYLAGRLSGDTLASFEQAMQVDYEIAEAVALQREIDGTLRRAFVPPRLPVVAGVAEDARKVMSIGTTTHGESKLRLVGEGDFGTTKRLVSRRWTWMAIAAALLLTTAGVFKGLLGGPDFNLVPPDQLYSFLQNGGWKPAQVCNTPSEFAALVKKRLGEGLIPDMAGAATSDVALLGWGYEDDYNGSPLTKKTMMLLTTVHEERVLVLIDQRKNRRPLHVRPGSTLNVIEREIGSLVVYEITPAKEPKVLPLLSVAKP